MVNCSLCGKEIPCPEDMVKSQKHACYRCFLELKEKIPDKEIEKIYPRISEESDTSLQALALKRV